MIGPIRTYFTFAFQIEGKGRSIVLSFASCQNQFIFFPSPTVLVWVYNDSNAHVHYVCNNFNCGINQIYFNQNILLLK